MMRVKARELRVGDLIVNCGATGPRDPGLVRVVEVTRQGDQVAVRYMAEGWRWPGNLERMDLDQTVYCASLASREA